MRYLSFRIGYLGPCERRERRTSFGPPASRAHSKTEINMSRRTEIERLTFDGLGMALATSSQGEARSGGDADDQIGIVKWPLIRMPL